MIRTHILVVAVLGFGGASTVLIWDGLATPDERRPNLLLQGFGSGTTGGEGGRILEVTSLSDAGNGTLRWALEEFSEPRIVQFGVSGVIHLEDQIEIAGNVSVWGASAPGSITITGGRLRVVGDNVILHGLRIRPGDGAGASPEDRDAISIGKAGTSIENIVIDGNSLSWAVDENLAIWGDVSDVTISNNIISYALEEAGHPKGAHSMGFLIGGGEVSRVSILGNLFAHNQHRNPAIKDNSRDIEFINNVVYNYGDNGLTADDSLVHVEANTFIAGEDSVERAPIALRHTDPNVLSYFVRGNTGGLRGNGKVSAAHVFEPSGVQPISATEALEKVLASAGAREPALDAVDIRVISDVKNLEGKIINSPADLGLAYPN